MCVERSCMVHGFVDFRSVDPVAKIISEGIASFDSQVTWSGNPFKINLEKWCKEETSDSDSCRMKVSQLGHSKFGVLTSERFKSGHSVMSDTCPLYPQKRTSKLTGVTFGIVAPATSQE